MLAYQDAVDQFIALSNFYNPTKTNSRKILDRRLKNVRLFLDQLQKPDTHYKIIHVTGTSGKGTVANLLKYALHIQGIKVGALISPHTTTFLERFQWQNQLAPVDKLIESIQEITHIYHEYLKKNDPLSFFDLNFILSCVLYSKLKAEYVIIEVGCGGRYDGTNAIEHSELSIITNINKDHTHILGNTLEEIAYEKAGIIKQDGLVIVGETRPKLKKIFCDEAIQNHAALFFVPASEADQYAPWKTLEMNHNLKIAQKALQELYLENTLTDHYLQNYQNLPCRFEKISDQPLIILDGSHNPSKMQATANLIKDLKKPMIAIFGCGTSKDQINMIKKLSPHITKIHTSRHNVLISKAHNPFTLLKQIPSSKRGEAFLNPKHALQHCLDNLPKDHGIIITGSLYLAGEIRKNWISEKDIIAQETSFPN